MNPPQRVYNGVVVNGVNAYRACRTRSPGLRNGLRPRVMSGEAEAGATVKLSREEALEWRGYETRMKEIQNAKLDHGIVLGGNVGLHVGPAAKADGHLGYKQCEGASIGGSVTASPLVGFTARGSMGYKCFIHDKMFLVSLRAHPERS